MTHLNNIVSSLSVLVIINALFLISGRPDRMFVLSDGQALQMLSNGAGEGAVHNGLSIERFARNGAFTKLSLAKVR